MEKELIETINGFRIYAVQDDCAENPFKSWDCNPPILTFYDRHLTGYAQGSEDADAVTIYDFLPHIGDAELLKIFQEDADNNGFPEVVEGYLSDAEGDVKDAFAEYVAREGIAAPGYWSCAKKYFDLLESLANAANIPCYNGTVSGYSQGDATRVFVASPHNTQKEHGNGAKLEETTADLYAAWAFGDVYGYVIEEVTPEDDGGNRRIDLDEEDTNESCWGYYGRDHEESGLLEAARNTVAYLVTQREKEAKESLDAACRDIVTV